MPRESSSEQAFENQVRLAVTSRLTEALRQNPKTSYEGAQGLVGELWVKELLGDEERVEALLKKWREAEVATGGAKEGIAAKNPDWLILDGNGEIAAIIEIKATKSNLAATAEDRKAYREIWDENGLNSLVPQDEEKRREWEARINRYIQSSANRYTQQIEGHLRRLRQLSEAGILRVKQPVRASLYVPEGEDFQIQDGKILDSLFDVKATLPPLESISKIIQEACQEISPELKLSVAPRASAASVVQERKGMIVELLVELQKSLSAEGVDALDERIGLLLLGGPKFDAGEKWDDNEPRAYEARETGRNIGRLLRRLNSTAPSLTGHLLFEAAGKKPFTSFLRGDRVALERLFSMVEDEQKRRRLVQMAGKMRVEFQGKLRGVALPSLEGVVDGLIELRQV